MYSKIANEIKKANTTLVAVSKTNPPEKILEIYEQGQRDFGENRIVELIEKEKVLPKDIRWHMIGHLQTKKVKKIADFIHLIHSVDNLHLLKEIDKRAKNASRVIDCLLQFHIAEEEAKYGMTIEESSSILDSTDYKNMKNIRITGVMGMATFTSDEDKIRTEFQNLAQIFSILKEKYFSDKDYFKEISMGMSADYQIAIEEGSTIVRIGTLIFR